MYNLLRLKASLGDRIYKSPGFKEFTINERGKQRHIKAVHISERIIQKVLCDKFLVPLLSRSLIYDNGATLKNKGTTFTLNRLKTHLHKYYREHNNSNIGYILIYDFSDYFGSINHDILKSQLNKYDDIDDDIRKLIFDLIDNFGSVGLGLGSQVSQILSVAFPNKIDQYFKSHMGIKYYGRYMDDGYVICESMDMINECKEKLYELCDELDINISERKIKICRIDKEFRYLKKDISLSPTGKVTMSLCNDSFRRARKRLRDYKTMMEQGKIDYNYIERSYIVWRGWAMQFDNLKSIHSLDNYFNELFDTCWDFNKRENGKLTERKIDLDDSDEIG
jgi:hypothetical protein